MVKRDVPPEGTDPDRNDFYASLSDTATKINIDSNDFGMTAVLAGAPNGQDIQVMMEGLQGCLGIFVVSHNGTYPQLHPMLRLRLALSTQLLTSAIGFFMSHSWQKQTLNANPQADTLFQSDVIDLLAYVNPPIMTTRNFTKTRFQ